MKEKQDFYQHDSIKKEIKKFILFKFLPGDEEQSLKDDDLLFEGGIIDSAGALTLISFLEQRYNIEIYDEELFPENFASVVHIFNFITEKIQEY